jgi:hypothetical protein
MNQFPISGKIDVLREIPGKTGSHFYFPREGVGPYSLVLRVEPAEGASWIGSFRDGYETAAAVTGAFGWPDPQRICAISKGQGYLVNVGDPSDFVVIDEVFPIYFACPVVEKGLFVLADFTGLAAFSAEGLKWQRDRISWDGLKNIEIKEEDIIGEAWSAPEETWIPFEIDISTGEKKGGVS